MTQVTQNNALNSPSGIVFDTLDNLFISDEGNRVIRKINYGTNALTTLTNIPELAGYGDISFDIAGGSENGGNLFLTNSTNNLVRKIVFPTNQPITVYNDVNNPRGLAFDSNNNIYIADTNNHRIIKIQAVTGIVTTVAGKRGVQGFRGDSGLAKNALLNYPRNITIDSTGILYIADTGNNKIRKVGLDGNIQTLVTGVDTQGQGINSPYCLAFNNNALYVVSQGNNKVYRLSTIQTGGRRKYKNKKDSTRKKNKKSSRKKFHN
jgi:sugar lactone lactonase YvrE